MIDARTFYNLLKGYATLQDKVFCDVHNCSAPDTCGHRQSHPIINFDDVKTAYCISRRESPCASADGVSFNDDGVFFFIEAKSWILFEKHFHPDSAAMVNKQVNKYRFNDKLKDSLIVSKGIASISEIELSLPVVYIVVTDASLQTDALGALNTMLSHLSQTSSDLSVIYGKEISSRLSDIVDVDNFYLDNCQELDSVISSWKHARVVKLL